MRGLEALALSVPPTPGESHREAPEQREPVHPRRTCSTPRATQSEFLYGGYGDFDNMNYFFGHNGYAVDRRDIPKDATIHPPTSGAWPTRTCTRWR